MKTLLQHRQELAANPEAYAKGLKRAARTSAPHLKKAGYPLLTPTRSEAERTEFVQLIFRAQGERPFFHIEAPFPYCWNAPSNGGWDINYIKYEWGHLRSINQNPESAFEIENLCLMSARCNQHIQSSMNVEELLVYGGALEAAIRQNLASRQALFASEAWKSLIAKLHKFKMPYNRALQPTR
jgi:hypothetical protein